MTTMTLAPVEQINHRHLNPEDQADVFPKSGLPEMMFRPTHSMPQHPYQLPAMYLSHALPVPMEGDGRAMATFPPSSVVPVSVPLRPAVMYPGYSNCAAVYSTATRGSYSTMNRRHSGGSMEMAGEDHQADDGSPDDAPCDGKTTQEVCRYFMRTGTCGYGDKCRYHHPQSAHRPKLNSMGYPQREAEHACPFYLKNGWCGFGATCKFNHPELPPLNVPAATMMPPMLTPVPYSTIPPPPYASVSPGGAYSTVPPAPATPMMHWPLAPAGVPMNVNPPQSGMYHQPYVSHPAVPAWPMKEISMPLASHGTPSAAHRFYQKPSDSRPEAVPRHTTPKSEDSAFAVVGQDVSLPRHQIGVETKHALMPMHATEDASHVSVTTA